MRVTNVRGYPLELAATGEVCEPGDSLEVEDALGASLLEQPDNWAPAKATKATKGNN